MTRRREAWNLFLSLRPSLETGPEIEATPRERRAFPENVAAGEEKGFTLLEVMVALAVTALCLGLVTVSLVGLHRAQQRAQEHMELLQTLSEASARIRTLLQSAYLPEQYPNQLLTEFETFDADSPSAPYDAITFTTTAFAVHSREARQSDLQPVTLFTEEEPALETEDGQRLRLRRLRLRVGGRINSRFEVEGGAVFTLADHVTRFLLEYQDPFGVWKPEWKPGDYDKYSLPCAIRVRLGVRSRNLEEIQSMLLIPMETTRFNCRFEDERVFEE